MTPEAAKILAQIAFDLYESKKAQKVEEAPFVGTLVLRNPRGACGWTINCGSDEVWREHSA